MFEGDLDRGCGNQVFDYSTNVVLQNLSNKDDKDSTVVVDLGGMESFSIKKKRASKPNLLNNVCPTKCEKLTSEQESLSVKCEKFTADRIDSEMNKEKTLVQTCDKVAVRSLAPSKNSDTDTSSAGAGVSHMESVSSTTKQRGMQLESLFYTKSSPVIDTRKSFTVTKASANISRPVIDSNDGEVLVTMLPPRQPSSTAFSAQSTCCSSSSPSEPRLPEIDSCSSVVNLSPSCGLDTIPVKLEKER